MVRGAAFVLQNEPLSTQVYSNEVTLSDSPQPASGWQLVVRGTNHVIKGLGFPAPTPQPPGEGQGLETDLITSSQRFTQ